MFTVTRKASRIEITLEVKKLGEDYLLTLTGGKEHAGAVAVGLFDEKSGRASSSVITLPGHREEQLALDSARRVSKATGKTSIVVVGIHVDNISLGEIKEIVSTAEEMVGNFIASCEKSDVTARRNE
ncbi:MULTISPECIES: prenylated flavin chaperone LpdD [Methanosarcina]|uniref:Prenylated flavin chaperone LpdD-like domain-containing protein n=4 Tax=Methanosarcina mazei TaxID=2209 RepID=A0A0F8JH87_METMZ|nr:MULTISPECIES: hypothetical protein [Methanosarcina]AGF97282.1 Hypothetical protein MmTuc01_1946 [Methanosarcina mazei Tuc01]AKB41736.1 hypothetical protein MSMAW_2745 [Methanosarcina mazei WWM610]AKB71513.1 hypothetical protein MSMAC_1623 [Methanosarcina mazei C16]KKG17413.1 hypothetical protein DU34_17320 [Methanosarcina mazei]KKG70400.1 hypothetical protein DU63_08690 [Methanosarcina mazei]